MSVLASETVLLPPGEKRANLDRSFVAMKSGGGGSWAASRRIADQYGPDQLTLLFTDVKGTSGNPHLGEDEDTYRFLRDAVPDIRSPLAWVMDGRDIWDVFYEKSWLGNSSLSHCSWELKTIPARHWLADNCDPSSTTVVVGMDWTEGHRHEGVYRNYAHSLDGCANPDLCRSLFDRDGRLPGPGCANLLPVPWQVELPMADRPLVAKPQVLNLMRSRGLMPPRMYALGFAHANCITCVKGGHAHWAMVLERFPEHYAYAQKREEEFRQSAPNRGNVSILKDRTGGQVRPLTLAEFAQRFKRKHKQLDLFELQYDVGGCGCANDAKPVELLAAA